METPSGYSDTDDYIAIAHQQAELPLLSVQVGLPHLVKMVKLPDPETQTDYNRPLKKGHAEKYGKYLDIAERPYTPPISLFTDPDNLEMVELEELPKGIGNVRFVFAKFVRTARDQVHILDGQHRIYGVHLLMTNYQEELEVQRQHLRRAEKVGGSELIRDARAQVQEAKDKIERLSQMTITVEIALTGDKALAKQIFADVADNALGISRSILSEFSTRSAFNRAAQELSAEALDGTIDTVKDRMGKSNPHWLSLRDVVNVIQTLELGLGKKWTHVLEPTLDESKLVKRGAVFFAGVATAYPEIQGILDGKLAGPEGRVGGSNPSLLGSATMVRVMAAVYRDLQAGDESNSPMEHDDVIDFFKTLPMQAGYVGTPDSKESAEPQLDKRWLDTGKFPSYPWGSPIARAGDVSDLVSTIVGWARSGV